MTAMLFGAVGCSGKKKSPTAKADLDTMDEGLSDTSEFASPSSGLDSLEEEVPSLDSGPRMSSEPVSSFSSPTTPSPSMSSRPVRTAPRPDPRERLKVASDSIHADLVDEKNAFFFKRIPETEAFYASPQGTVLIPQSTLKLMTDMLGSRLPVDLKIECKSMDMLAPVGAEEESSVANTSVDILGQPIDASIKFTGQVTRPTLNVGLIYSYSVDGGAVAKDSKTLQVARMVQYAESTPGKWQRVRIEERIVPK